MTVELIAEARALVAEYETGGGRPSMIERQILTGMIVALADRLAAVAGQVAAMRPVVNASLCIFEAGLLNDAVDQWEHVMDCYRKEEWAAAEYYAEQTQAAADAYRAQHPAGATDAG